MENPSSSPQLIKLSDAARYLGYQSTQPIKKLISENYLQKYKLPDSKRVLVDKIELESLLTPFEVIADVPGKKMEPDEQNTHSNE